MPVEVRAADLKDQVATLRASFADLLERLEALEEAFDREESGALDEKPRRRPAKPKPKPPEETKPAPSPDAPATSEEDAVEADEEEAPADPPAEEPDDGLDPAIRELVGSYTLDLDAFVAAMTDFIRTQLRAELGDVPDEIVDGAIEAMRSQLTSMEFELVLEADMSFEVSSTMGGEPTSASGTWERDGESVTLHQTQEDGEDMDEPFDIEGTWDGTNLRLRPDPEVPVELVLSKNP